MKTLAPFFRSIVMVGALASAGAASAGTAAGTFNVAITFTSSCQARTTPTADFGAYTAFAAPKTATATISFRCTRSLASTPTITKADNTGSVAGITYTLAMGATSVVAAQTGDAGVSGTYDVYNATVTADMVNAQAGDASASAAPTTHNVTITF